MIGVAVAVIAIAAAYISFSDSQGIGTSGLITDLAMPYEKRSTDAYELELPTGWQLQPRDISDVEFDAITTGATGDQMRGQPVLHIRRSQNRWRKIFPRQAYTSTRPVHL